MKTCRVCNISKSFDEFAQNRSTCKICRAEYNSQWRKKNSDLVKKYYEKNKEYRIELATRYYVDNRAEVLLRNVSYTKNRRKKTREYLRSYKSNHPCIKCGESDPSCLDFHHRDTSKKEAELSIVARLGWSKKRIDNELKKCDVLCANCHRKHHA